MEADMAGTGAPGHGGMAGLAGGHVHRLLALAAALARACNTTGASAAGALDPLPPFGVDTAVLSDRKAVHWAQSLEQLSRFLDGLKVQAAGDLAARTYAHRFTETGASNPAQLLRQSLQLSPRGGVQAP